MKKLIPATLPVIWRHAITTGQLEHLGSATRCGCKDIPGGMSEPQVYRSAGGQLYAAACRSSNFPNVFFHVSEG